MSNSLKIFLFGFTVSVGLLFFGFELADRLGLFLGALCACLVNLLVFLYGQSKVIQKLNGKKLSGQDPWGLLLKLEKIAKSESLELPQLYLLETATPTALFEKPLWGPAQLAVSQGLLKHLTGNEVQAVLYLQVLQAKKCNRVSIGVCMVICNSLLGLAQFIDEFLPFQRRIFSLLAVPLGNLFLKFSLRQHLYLQADFEAAKKIADKKDLASALFKISSFANTTSLQIPACSAHLFVVAPKTNKNRREIFRFQPELKFRIKNIIGTYPI